MEPRHRNPGLNRQEAAPTGSQFARPSSLTGRLLLRSMNIGHARLHRWGLEAAEIHPCDKVLSVGCGGDRVIAQILTRTRREVASVDHSPEAVGTTRRLNRSTIASGRLRVLEGSVDHLPFRDGFFSVATAFGTTYFWPGLRAGLVEIRRVLGPGGRLVITSELADRETAGRWAEHLNMNVPDGRSLAILVHEAGFLAVDVSIHPRHGWLRLLATRQERRRGSRTLSHGHARSGAAPGGPVRCHQWPDPP